MEQEQFLNNRGFNYGDGCFTTMLVLKNNVCFLQDHIARLMHACSALQIKHINEIHIKNRIFTAIKENITSCDNAYVLKVVITRGDGGRGYAPDQHTEPHIFISRHAYPSQYETWRKTGIAVGVSGFKLGIQPALAGIKHLNRLEQVMVKLHQSHDDVNDDIVLDVNNFVVECSASNIFWKTDGAWYTPSLQQAGIQGIMRKQIIHRFSQRHIPISETQSLIDEVQHAEAAFCCNSVMGIIPIVKIKTQSWTHNMEICPETQGMHQELLTC
ncbi:aminodeoxychorismate lyase [Aestuariibacter sp. AA17]|uniref:Aminodeoxychorismate lyase n=1 Tax=Fluctibacter corallii TaxID=2984329 RepID=A0ABT3A6I7_9ALTE|nr:aminodeoxychorismate lyase [Aestuariibacter sp. AA17]MCV2884273.1 aminodeoxychorismate lyase [Aestuariibacter sp. AA17]